MTTRPEQHPLSLYVDRNLPTCWVVRDRAGAFWTVPVGDRPGNGGNPTPSPKTPNW